MINQAKKLERAQAAKRPKEKAAKKGNCQKTNKGVDRETLAKKTGLKDINTWTILYRLSKQGKIKPKGKGLYVKDRSINLQK